MVFEGLPPSPIWQRAGSFHHFCFELLHYIKRLVSCIVFESLPLSIILAVDDHICQLTQ